MAASGNSTRSRLVMSALIFMANAVQVRVKTASMARARAAPASERIRTAAQLVPILTPFRDRSAGTVTQSHTHREQNRTVSPDTV
jgi:hypothetical protein